MRSRCTLALLHAATLAAWGACADPTRVAHAQQDDDWSLTREPARSAPRRLHAPKQSDDVVRDRQRRAALADPSDELTFEQLRTGELARTGGLEALSGWLRRETEGARREPALLVLVRVLASVGQGDEALQRLHEARMGSARPGRATRLRVTVLRELGRSAEAALELEGLAAAERSSDERASLWRAAARERLRADDPEGALRALAEAALPHTRAGLSAREEQRVLELAAFRRAGKLAELARRLADQGDPAHAAAVWEELGDVEQALAAYRFTAARAPTDLASRASVARLLAQRGQFVEAEHEARELLRRAPGKLEYVVPLAELLRAAGRRQDALAELAAFARRRAADVSVHRALRELYVGWEEPGLAEQELRSLATLAPRAPEPRVTRADQALVRGERAEAVALLVGERAAARTAADEAALSDLLAERDLLPEALEHGERAVALSPHSLAYLRARASLLERSGRNAEAEQAFRALLEHPGADRNLRREARQHVVSAWSRAGTLALHVAELRAKENSSGLDGPETLLLTELYARDAQQLPAQAALLERWLAQAPRDLDAWLALSRAKRQQGDLPGIVAAWSALLATGDAEVSAYTREAVQAALDSAHEPAAMDLVERARTLSPRDPAVLRLAGDFYAARADRVRSRAAYERALQLDPGDAAVRLALASEAFANADAQRGRELLSPLLTNVDDDERRQDAAARLLLRRDPEHAERTLLEASRAGAASPALRRLLFEHWAVTLLPLAARVDQGTASEPERVSLNERVLRCLGILLVSLSSGAQRERDVALGLLDAVPAPAALGSLLALAEASERPQHERARALRILGRLRVAAAVPRLSALYASAPRTLRPFALWALVASGAPGAPAALRAELDARSRDQRALSAVLSIGVTVSATSEALQRLADDDPDATVRAACRWALARARGEDRSSAPALLLDAPGNEGVLALLSRVGRDALAEGLFVADARVRELAAAYLRGERRAHERPPAPRWPFVLDDYLLELAQGEPVASEVPGDRLVGVARALASRLAGERSVVESTLRVLTPHAGGIVPSALLRAGCAPAGLAAQLAQVAHVRLASLLAGDDTPLQLLALRLLVLGGGAELDEVLRFVERGSDEAQREGLRVLAQLPALPTRLRPVIERLARESPQWPTRMWATRALHAEANPAGGEPVALVRASAHTERGAAPSSTVCEAARPATN
ncbi:MAG: hypothetical protein RLZZ450_2840 [Pseudomonadota bacterium]|jgi:predicted Zn-dependent protease